MPDPLQLEQSPNCISLELAVDDLEIEDILTSRHFLVVRREVAIGVTSISWSKVFTRWADGSTSQAFCARLGVTELLLQFVHHGGLGSELLGSLLCLESTLLCE